MGKEVWHLVEAKRADDSPTIFRIRELEPRLEQPRIFVTELPYPVADASKLPDAPSYRRFATFEEQWLDPACHALGWTTVGVKIEDGSFFVYAYGAGDPQALVQRLAPFDGELAFFDEHDPTWDEYAALRELLDEARTLPAPAPKRARPRTTKPATKPASQPGSQPEPTPTPTPKPKPKPKARRRSRR